eukprot:comp24031_c3_seq1/m.43015 comp24031_c3_seq1/g.43015  ORF comp24031_c3_seq1/g.43015 comp24031_c3_seq1/m.43015 type:complete len:254 (-) comp24031_c3_seq1:531-1292(-)
MEAAVRQLPDGVVVGEWTISTHKGKISNSEYIDSVSAELGIPVPDMLFGANYLRIARKGTVLLEFNPLDALRLVDKTAASVKVEWADQWNAGRQDAGHIKKVINPFDWTFTTAYKGTVPATAHVQVAATEEAIDMDSLRVQEKILFYDDVILYEDELDDSGSVRLNVRVRVMPSGFFVLQRLYMRVDGVMVRINDTRVHHRFGSGFMLREYASKEEAVPVLKQSLQPQDLANADVVGPHLKQVQASTDKLTWQ